MVEVFVLKPVRIWFTKDNECKYISHLDLNRVVMRALHKSKLNIWHTEGFNPHPFVTFALPLSLGFKGVKETMDIKLLDDDYNKEEIISALNNCLPSGIKVYDVTEPVMKNALCVVGELNEESEITRLENEGCVNLLNLIEKY